MQTSEIDSLWTVTKVGFFRTQIDPLFGLEHLAAHWGRIVGAWASAVRPWVAALAVQTLIFHLEWPGKNVYTSTKADHFNYEVYISANQLYVFYLLNRSSVVL